MITYRGYSIWPNTKTVKYHNPISGYHWTIQVPIRGYHVSGTGVSCLDTFHTEKNAKAHIDFIIELKTWKP